MIKEKNCWYTYDGQNKHDYLNLNLYKKEDCYYYDYKITLENEKVFYIHVLRDEIEIYTNDFEDLKELDENKIKDISLNPKNKTDLNKEEINTLKDLLKGFKAGDVLINFYNINYIYEDKPGFTDFIDYTDYLFCYSDGETSIKDFLDFFNSVYFHPEIKTFKEAKDYILNIYDYCLNKEEFEHTKVNLESDFTFDQFVSFSESDPVEFVNLFCEMYPDVEFVEDHFILDTDFFQWNRL